MSWPSWMQLNNGGMNLLKEMAKIRFRFLTKTIQLFKFMNFFLFKNLLQQEKEWVAFLELHKIS